MRERLCHVPNICVRSPVLNESCSSSCFCCVLYSREKDRKVFQFLLIQCCVKLSDFVELIVVNKLLLTFTGEQKLKLLCLLSLPGKQHIWILLSSTKNRELNLVESSLHLLIIRYFALP